MGYMRVDPMCIPYFESQNYLKVWSPTIYPNFQLGFVTQPTNNPWCRPCLRDCTDNSNTNGILWSHSTLKILWTHSKTIYGNISSFFFCHELTYFAFQSLHIILFISITLFYGTDSIPQNILIYSPHSHWMWGISKNIMWNIVNLT